jgi:hypothetical protein
LGLGGRKKNKITEDYAERGGDQTEEEAHCIALQDRQRLTPTTALPSNHHTPSTMISIGATAISMTIPTQMKQWNRAAMQPRSFRSVGCYPCVALSTSRVLSQACALTGINAPLDQPGNALWNGSGNGCKNPILALENPFGDTLKNPFGMPL